MSRADLLRLRTSRWRYLGLVILLGLYFAQSVAASPWHNVTFDEQYHLTPGYPNSAFGRDADAFTSYSRELGQSAISATLLRVGLVSRLFNAYQARLAPITFENGLAFVGYEIQTPGGALRNLRENLRLTPTGALYNPDTLTRFKTPTGEDRLLLETLEVKP